jgi:hypothetical protein
LREHDGKTGQTLRVSPFNPPFFVGWLDIFNPQKWWALPRLSRKKRGGDEVGGLVRQVYAIFIFENKKFNSLYINILFLTYLKIKLN